MGYLASSAASLRLFGEFDPLEITALLRCEPTVMERRGEVIRYPSGRERTARSGQWRLEASRSEPEDLVNQIIWLLAQVTDDLHVWRELGKNFKPNIFCGLFMASYNDGLPLPPDVMLMLGQREILLDLDIYSPSGTE